MSKVFRPYDPDQIFLMPAVLRIPVKSAASPGKSATL
jgi:hypothetical protein